MGKPKDIRDTVIYRGANLSAMMTWTYRELNQMAMTEEILDQNNPAFIFSITPKPLLEAIADGRVNCRAIAKIMLSGLK